MKGVSVYYNHKSKKGKVYILASKVHHTKIEMGALTNQEVRLNCKFKVKTILKLNMIAKANEHACMFVKGIVDEQEDMNALMGEKISLTYQKEEDESVFFTGYIKDYKIHKYSGCRYIEMYSISLSGKLDESKKKCSMTDIKAAGFRATTIIN